MRTTMLLNIKCKCSTLACTLWVLQAGFLFLGLESSAQSLQSHRVKLFDTEISFAQMAAARGFKAANQNYVADDGIVFRPKAINAKEWASKQPDSLFGLSWHPTKLDISMAGDLGYALGPFVSRYNRNDTSKQARGQFVTVWQRQQDGSLKFVMDFGTGVLPDSFKVEEKKILSKQDILNSKEQDRSTTSQTSADQELRAAEDQLKILIDSKGEQSAFKSLSAEDLYFIYQRKFCFEGIKSVSNVLEKLDGRSEYNIEQIRMAQSGDMAHVWGTHIYHTKNATSKGYFMRIWKRTKAGWKIVVHVQNFDK